LKYELINLKDKISFKLDVSKELMRNKIKGKYAVKANYVKWVRRGCIDDTNTFHFLNLG